MQPGADIVPVDCELETIFIAVDAVLGIGSSILIHYREGLAPSDRAGADGAFEALFFEPSAIDWLDQGASAPRVQPAFMTEDDRISNPS